ncbi:hypothetical protein M5689_008368 [Euphorbia peplus]|nr:hypothetical protein M5689_008368 [Euphorbia peplus]
MLFFIFSVVWQVFLSFALSSHCSQFVYKNLLLSDFGGDDCPSLSEDVQKHASLQQCSSRKRESTSTDQRPSIAAIRICISEIFQELKITYDHLEKEIATFIWSM